jgi:predicted dienelactone hydrolase
LALAACDGDTAEDAGLDAAIDVSVADVPPVPDVPTDAGPVIGEIYGEPGPHPVGNQRVVMLDRTGERMLPVELWYPAVEDAREAANAGQPMAAFEAGTEHEAALMAAIEGSPPACIRSNTHSALAPAAITEPALLPVVVFSHCHACVRFDVAEVSERLASHGIVVAAPDHLDNTFWDAEPAPVGAAFLEVRVSDVRSVLDRLLDPTAAEMPDDLRGRIDPDRAAVMGHSFGAATTGPVVLEDDRFVAALAMAAPISVLAGLDPADIEVPFLFLLAQEDNSIGAAGNIVIRNDFRDMTTPSYLVEIPGAGHWSFTDIAGLGGQFRPGCAELDDRFAYPDPALHRELAADAAMGFFAARLLGDPEGDAFVTTGLRGRATVTGP